MANIFKLPSSLPHEELFETLVSADNILIERIISTGQTTAPGEWYDQDRDGWDSSRSLKEVANPSPPTHPKSSQN